MLLNLSYILLTATTVLRRVNSACLQLLQAAVVYHSLSSNS